MIFLEGPSLPYPLEKQSCGRILDKESGHMLVVIAGGDEETLGGTSTTDTTLIWDTFTDTIIKV